MSNLKPTSTISPLSKGLFSENKSVLRRVSVPAQNGHPSSTRLQEGSFSPPSTVDDDLSNSSTKVDESSTDNRPSVSMFQRAKESLQQHCKSATGLFWSPKLKADHSSIKGDSDKGFQSLPFASTKMLSSSLESLTEEPPQKTADAENVPTSTRWTTPLPCSGMGNLLQMKSFSSSSSHLMQVGDHCDGPDISTASPVSSDCLAELLTDSSSSCCTQVMLLDCRTFVCYNTNHITGSLNVSCADAISRKRLLCGRKTVGELVSGPIDAKECYRQAFDDRWQFVVYDDNAIDLRLLPATHPLRVIIICLQKERQQVHYLQGGLQRFHKTYSQLCTQPNFPPPRPLLSSQTTPVVTTDVDSAIISQILPHVYLGNERDSANRDLLAKLGITHILNVTAHVPFHFATDRLVYKRLPASDSGNQNLRQYFKEAILFIDEAERKAGCILVHCQAGVSRSSTVVIAYIMVRLSKSMLEAFQFVKSRRSIIAPNFNFMGQLLDFETSLSQRPLEKTAGHAKR